MPVTYTKGPQCKVFQDGPVAILVYDNGDTAQIALSTKRGEKMPYIIVPKTLCQEIGLELFELGRER